MNINPHYMLLSKTYLFMEIEERMRLLKKKRPNQPLFNLGIGDASYPIAGAVIDAICKATLELGNPDSFRGYGPSQGYLFLREAISHHEYNGNIHPDEIFISDGAKCDSANLLELFAENTRIALCDPAYPVYVDSAVLAGKSTGVRQDGTYQGISYLPCTEENQFLPDLPQEHCDVIYLCSPNNPTGVAFSKKELEKWVGYALKEEAIIIFDGAYEAFITSDAPRSIYEIEDAKKVAIEIRSFSKKAGFTSLRCSFAVVPKELRIQNEPLHPYWKRRVDTKFGGVPYPIQRGAEAVYSEEGKIQVASQIRKYQKQTRLLLNGLHSAGFKTYGGIDAPYIWCKTFDSMNSWEFFDYLLQKTGIISVPGRGFGPSGEGFVRFSAFPKETVLNGALQQLKEEYACSPQ